MSSMSKTNSKITLQAAEVCNKLQNMAHQKYDENMIYMDYQSTTPMDETAIEVMNDVMRNNFGNPHSRSHVFGWRAEELVDQSRKSIADVIGADAEDIVFTSGATESNNIAIKGVARFYKSEKKNHIITLNTEHKCVIESFRSLEKEGFEVTFLSPQPNGLLDIEELKKNISERTILVSIMAVHNEIGVIQDLKKIGEMAHAVGALFHTDAAQAFGKIELDVNEMNIDLMSISGHKIYGPKGVGALYVRRKPRVRLTPLFSGGGQERGIRSGTLAPFLIAGFATAAAIANQNMKEDGERIEKLGKKLWNSFKELEEVTLNGDDKNRYWGNVNISFAFIEGESLMMSMKNIAVSSGSACTSASLEPSYVLKALGLKDELAHSSIRFGIGKQTTEKEVDFVIKNVKLAVERLRDMSPLWEMFKEGIDIDAIEWDEH